MTTTCTNILKKVLLLCLLLRDTHATTLRGPTNTKTHTVQVEDYIVMQMEMAWGMKEMSRYRSHRGEWPTRSTSSFMEEEKLQQQPTQEEESHETNEQAKTEAKTQPATDQDELGEDQRLRGNQSESEHDTETPEDSPLLGEMDEEMAMLLSAKNAARTVEEYWDTLVAMF